MVRTDPARDGFQFVGDMSECPGCGEWATTLRQAAAGPAGVELCDDCLTTWKAERQRNRRVAGRPQR